MYVVLHFPPLFPTHPLSFLIAFLHDSSIPPNRLHRWYRTDASVWCVLVRVDQAVASDTWLQDRGRNVRPSTLFNQPLFSVF